ncbi:MAG TPA: hypothetical protein DEH78_32120 [Solibacterales bacterium]|nr:hypothetical protein [Bryobacterales bacterium]
MASSSVERRPGGFYIAGSRVPLDQIVYEYRNGEEPETIQSHYPTLSIEQVKAAIGFYLSNREVVDRAVEERIDEEEAVDAANPTPPDIRERFERMRRQAQSRRW